MQGYKSRLLVMMAGVFGAAVVTLLAHDVPTDLSREDKVYASKILSLAGYDPAHLLSSARQSFEAEVQTILKVQAAVFAAAPEHRGIPFGSEREPKDVFERKHGFCYDRGRVIAKLLSWLGFETRHVSVFSAVSPWPLLTLLTPDIRSHAVTEVQTREGWMVIDTNVRWIGLDADRDPVSLDDIQETGLRSWASENQDPIDSIFTKPFVQVRGLYSRHGYFYPPFSPLPDFNFRQIVSNVTD